MNYATFDIEAFDWSELKILGFTYQNKYYEFYNVDNFMDFLYKNITEKTFIYAHYSGGYDSLFIIDYLVRQNKKWKNIIIANGKVYELQVNDKIIFRDSILLLRSSLDSVLKAFKLKTQKIDFDYEKDFDNKVKLHDRVYNDVIGLYDSLGIFFNYMNIFDNKNIPLTLHSLILKKLKSDFSIKIPILNFDKNNFARQGYYGGRTELYRKEGKDINIYDVNSLYAYASLNKLPFDNGKNFDNNNFDILEKKSIEGYIELDFIIKECFISLFPIKYNNRIHWSYGQVNKGIYPISLIRYALTNNLIKIQKVYRSLIFYNNENIFESYVNYYYDKKLKAEKDGDTATRYIVKHLLAGVHGKLAQKPIREDYIFNPTNKFIKNNLNKLNLVSDYLNLWSYEIENKNGIFNCAIAGYITSYSNLIMYEYLNKYQNNLFYTDTDSLHLDIKLPKSLISDKIGRFKKEGSFKSVEYLQPKAYTFINSEGKSLYKVKAFKNYDIEKKECKFDRLISIKEYFKNPKLKKVTTKRYIRSKYESRIFNNDNKYYPVNFTELFNNEKTKKDNIIRTLSRQIATGYAGVSCCEKCNYYKQDTILKNFGKCYALSFSEFTYKNDRCNIRLSKKFIKNLRKRLNTFL